MKALLAIVLLTLLAGPAIAADLTTQPRYAPRTAAAYAPPAPYGTAPPSLMQAGLVSIDWPWITAPVHPLHDPLGWAVGFVPRVRW